MSKPGFTDEDYRLWKHHPVSKGVFEYLRLYRGRLEQELIARWLSGSLTLLDEKEARGRILFCDEMLTLPFEAIEAEFKQQQEEQTSEAEVDPATNQRS